MHAHKLVHTHTCTHVYMHIFIHTAASNLFFDYIGCTQYSYKLEYTAAFSCYYYTLPHIPHMLHSTNEMCELGQHPQQSHLYLLI